MEKMNNMKSLIYWIACLLLFTSPCLAKAPSVPEQGLDHLSYSIGYQVGSDFKNQLVEIVPDLLLRGIQDALAQTKPLMSPERMRATLVELQKRVAALEQEQKAQAGEAYRGEGREFMATNAERDGVVALPSGLQYQVLTPGHGKSPLANDRVQVNYVGRRLDGQEFDRSPDGEPVELSLGQVIPSWKEALQLMREGAKWRLFVPADLAFGEHGPLADQTVIFEVELLKVLEPSVN